MKTARIVVSIKLFSSRHAGSAAACCAVLRSAAICCSLAAASLRRPLCGGRFAKVFANVAYYFIIIIVRNKTYTKYTKYKIYKSYKI